MKTDLMETDLMETGPMETGMTDGDDKIDIELQAWLDQRDAIPLAHVHRRLERERRKAARVRRTEEHSLRGAFSVRALVRAGARLPVLRGRGLRNARAVSVVHHRLGMADLPETFEGLRVLHISDPHFGADAGIDAAIVDAAGGTEHDLCVLTGDYRHRSFGPIDTALTHLARLRDALDGEMLAVFGNHDAMAMAPPMEAMGIGVLLNECRTLERDGAALHVLGVDDPSLLPPRRSRSRARRPSR